MTASSRNVWRMMTGIAILSAVLLPGVSHDALAGGGNGKGNAAVVPPNANYRGRSFNEWCVLCSEWTVATGLGGQNLPDTVDRVRLLSGAFTPGEYQFTIEIRPGTGLMATPFFVFGELYEDGSMDDPEALADVIELIKQTTYVETRFDGKVILDGFVSDLDAYGFGVTDYDEPIVYTEPQPRDGFPDAVAALWTFGVGTIYQPPSVGTHVLEHIVDAPFFGGTFIYRYDITVTPPGKH